MTRAVQHPLFNDGAVPALWYVPAGGPALDSLTKVLKEPSGEARK